MIVLKRRGFVAHAVSVVMREIYGGRCRGVTPALSNALGLIV
jgi:hypothetical protein